ncbi:hypothetical protein [Thauera humireducens]|uniref:hypothetical protein n=1 Tax=Thauera humireducens TaxID=1134435 RepID=UPI003C765488
MASLQARVTRRIRARPSPCPLQWTTVTENRLAIALAPGGEIGVVPQEPRRPSRQPVHRVKRHEVRR